MLMTLHDLICLFCQSGEGVGDKGNRLPQPRLDATKAKQIVEVQDIEAIRCFLLF